MNDIPKVNNLLLSWKLQVERNEKMHRSRALCFRTLYYCLGVPATILSGLFTASSLTTIHQCTSLIALCIIQSIAGALVTVLIGIQTYMQLTTRFEQNKFASDRYQALLRTIETTLNTENKGDELNNIQRIFDDIVSTSPVLPVERKHRKYSFFNILRYEKDVDVVKTKHVVKDVDVDVVNNVGEANDVVKTEDEVWIDIALEENMKKFRINPELQYQIDRLTNQNIN